jgi:hypothetical protein
MIDRATVTASFIGNPQGGDLNDPFPTGQPAQGERVALFAFLVRSVDGDPEGLRRYHVAPAASATEGPLGPSKVDPQGDTVQWVGCGTGTILRLDGVQCEVAPTTQRWSRAEL